MPKYLVKERSFIGHAIREEGDIIDYDPPKGTTVSDNLEPLEKADVVEDTLVTHVYPASIQKPANKAEPEIGPVQYPEGTDPRLVNPTIATDVGVPPRGKEVVEDTDKARPRVAKPDPLAGVKEPAKDTKGKA